MPPDQDPNYPVWHASAPSRRESILAAAAVLFSESGFAATGMNDIGAAVGITGGGLYRHFASKQEVLHAIVTQAVEQTMQRVGEIVIAARTPEELLRSLVDNLITMALDHRALLTVVWREQHNLDAKTRGFVDRAHRLHVAEWVSALAQLRPELAEGERATLVHLVWGCVMWGVEYDSGLDPQRLRDLLMDSALRMLWPLPLETQAQASRPNPIEEVRRSPNEVDA
jgi:AcrR family transcriptional regulator